MQKVTRSSGSDYVVSSSSGLKWSKLQYKKFLSKDCSDCCGYFLCSSGHSPNQLKWRAWKPAVGWSITVTGELITACQWMKGNTKLQTLFQRKGLQELLALSPPWWELCLCLGCTQDVHTGLRGDSRGWTSPGSQEQQRAVEEAAAWQLIISTVLCIS